MGCETPSKEEKGNRIALNPDFHLQILRYQLDNMTAKPMEEHIELNTEILSPMRTTESVMFPIPRDTFEKLYLTPKMPIAGNLRRTFGNPTPISLMGFLVSATPNAMLHMGWRGAGGDGGAIL